jgi:hypothetical protein
MKNIKILLVMAFITLQINNVFSQDNSKGGIVYGEKWAFWVMAPDGWIMDSNSLARQGIYGLFYEEGKIFGSQYNTPIIYIVPFPLNNDSDNDLRNFAETDIAGYKKNGAKVENINRVISNITNFYLIYNVDLTNGRYETFVFTHFGNLGLIIIINANNVQQRNELFPKMVEIINSIKIMDIIHN